MNKPYVVGGIAAGLLLAGCGSAADSEEYRALSTDAATTQHELDRMKTSLDAMTAERDHLQSVADRQLARADNLQVIVDGSRADQVDRADDLRADLEALQQRADALDEREQAIDDKAAAVADANMQAGSGGFGASGTFVVGADIAVGSYFARGGSDCRWAFVDGTEPESEVLLSEGGAAPQYVAMAAGDVFQTQGCGAWVPGG